MSGRTEGGRRTAVERLQQRRGTLMTGTLVGQSSDLASAQAAINEAESMSSMPAEEHLEALRSFVDEFSADMEGVLETVGETGVGEVWDPVRDAIEVDLQSTENCEMRELLKTDNKVIYKVVTVLAVLCDEAVTLQREVRHRFFPPLAFYGETCKDEPLKEGEESKFISNFLSAMQPLSQVIKRINYVVQAIVGQLSSLFAAKQRLYIQTFRGAHFLTVFKRLEELLGILISFDALVQSSPALQQHWEEYKRMLKSCELEPQLFGVDEEQLATLQLATHGLEVDVFEGSAFRNCIAQDFTWTDGQNMIETRMNKVFLEEMLFVIKNRIDYLATHIGAPSESDQPEQLIGFAGLFALFLNFNRGKEPDKKILKAVFGLQRKVPLVHVYGRAVFNLAEFLSSAVPLPVKVEIPSLQAIFPALVAQFQAEISSRYNQIASWMTRMESDLKTDNIAEKLRQRCNLLVSGVLLAWQVSNLTRTVLFMHYQLGAPYKQSTVRAVSLGIELLKAVKFTYYRCSTTVSEQFPHVLRHLQSSIDSELAPLRSTLEQSLGGGKRSNWRKDDLKLDALSEITLISHLLQGSATPSRRSTMNLLWDMVIDGSVPDNAQNEIRFLFRRLDLVSELQRNVDIATHCSFLFSFMDLLPTMLKDILNQPPEAHRLHYLLSAVRDPLTDLGMVMHMDTRQELQVNYEAQVLEAVEENIVQPLCQEIEKDLRLQIHTSQIAGMAQHNPVKEGVKDWSHLTKMRPIRFGSRTVDLRSRVAHYLDTIFYNLTTVALHDWKTYGEMRKLAEEKYAVVLTDSHLPTGTLEQGLDVLEVMRHIHVFVSRFSYSLNTQVFVEKPRDNKYINSIGIPQVANSIRTHGMGIMNTTVNYTYQYLARKFQIFSQFLYDDHIKSRLIKDIRHFQNNREQLNNQYPFDRAEKFNRDIRKLGLTEDGSTFLDKFRELITEIGNALGFVRMIRAGGLNFCSNAVKIVPDVRKEPKFKENTQGEAGLSEETKQAAQNVDTVVEDIMQKFAEGTDFLQLLVDVFGETLRSEAQSHLQNFFMILPPLTINFVDHMMSSKDKLIKSKRSVAGTFTDDGFAIGIAYVLGVLQSQHKFESLHWFDSVSAKIAGEKARLDSQKAERRRGNDEEIQTVQMSISRLASRQMEFDLLYYSLSGANVFFKTD